MFLESFLRTNLINLLPLQSYDAALGNFGEVNILTNLLINDHSDGKMIALISPFRDYGQVRS